MSYRVLVCAIGSMVAAPAMGQFSITPGGANAGNGFFSQGAQPTSATGAGLSAANFTATTSSGQDQAFAQWWWFRANNDTREFAFANTTTAPFTMVGTLVGNNAGTLDTGGYDYTVSSTSGYSFNAALRWQIVAGTPGPQVNYSAQITNTSPAGTPLNLALFNYLDLDVAGTSGTDTWSFTGGQYVVSDGAVSIGYSGNGFAARQTTAFATLRGLLSNTAVDNLNNTDAGSPGDFTGGYQWNLQLGPGGVALITGSVAFVPAPGALALLGLGGLIASRRRRA